MKIRVQYPADPSQAVNSWKITDAETGCEVSGVTDIRIDSGKPGTLPRMTIEKFAYMDEIDVTADANVVFVCPCCRATFPSLQHLRDMEKAGDPWQIEHVEKTDLSSVARTYQPGVRE